jgi:hypothetical protein
MSSGNFMFNDKFVLELLTGSAAVTAMAGFQISDMYVG